MPAPQALPSCWRVCPRAHVHFLHRVPWMHGSREQGEAKMLLDQRRVLTTMSHVQRVSHSLSINALSSIQKWH